MWSTISDWFTQDAWTWFAQRGWKVLVVILVAVVLYYTLHRVLRPLLRKVMAAPLRKREEAEITRKADAMAGAVFKTSMLVIAIVALLVILEAVGVNIPGSGWRIVFIVIGSLGVYFALRLLIPSVIQRAVSAQMRGQEDEEVKQRTDTLSGVLVKTSMAIIAAVALFMVLAEVGINIAPALAGLGVVGIAVGFGAQSLIKDLIAGLFILLENQYSVGDVVKVAGITGLVQEINLRRTVLRDLDGIVHSVPNGEITVASNYTQEWSRVNMNISVGYGEDLDHVIEVINRLGKDMASEPYWGSMMLTPPQVLRVDAFEDSGIAIKILGDTKPIKQWEIMGEMRRRIKRVFDEEGIEIPWPHTKVFFGEPLEHRTAKDVVKPAESPHRPPTHEAEVLHTEEVLPPSNDE